MMKKFVAGKGAAGLILAGLMVSSGAMAAAGDVVTGGSGTVKINIPLVTSTCTVTVPTEVNFDQINKNNIHGGFIASKNFDITLSHCSGKTVKMTVKSPLSTSAGSDPYLASLSYPYLTYDIQIPNPGATITGGEKYYNAMVYDFTGNKPFTIIPDSDSYTFTSKVDLLVANSNVTTDGLPDTISGSFTYNVTYM
ncbi:TPA: type 1 fimbrial protein [Salmonella enterica subsp. enterica]|nr:type 1 fimbrial protein [Salmonella enterica subsp. enterica serovar Veneziana]EBV3064295.1 type 1 fimbrial protein [Salmonella enterica subsp. enterica serovar Veneziana]ECJ8655078.1 type 1 fimbrial protein [Salmonella enterica subsp. enterica serovar Veneziana]HBZ8591368.1 type 1 fimbrial protein [Salmonella enterica subsp. enterica]